MLGVSFFLEKRLRLRDCSRLLCFRSKLRDTYIYIYKYKESEGEGGRDGGRTYMYRDAVMLEKGRARYASDTFSHERT